MKYNTVNAFGGEDFMIRTFTMNDYDEAYRLWERTPGVGLRNLDDSREGITRFIERNPSTNFVAEEGGRIIGVALSGHDGRRGYLYHTCVADTHRRRSVGKQLVEQVAEAMKAEKITKLALVCYSHNESGNGFWSGLGFTHRKDLNYYTFSINEDNE
jgi:ribosomal protein S18 acetylase RimI-like enzyme